MIQCNICSQVKPSSEFYWRTDTQKHEGTCKSCRKRESAQRANERRRIQCQVCKKRKEPRDFRSRSNKVICNRCSDKTGTSLCSVCGQTKANSEFYKKDRRTGRLDTTCKSCRIVDERRRHLGVEPEDYWRMYHEQGGKCGVCRRRLYSKRYKSFCVDHDHNTGRIRGLLCHNCNRGIGLLQDSVDNFQRAIDWVKV